MNKPPLLTPHPVVAGSPLLQRVGSVPMEAPQEDRALLDGRPCLDGPGAGLVFMRMARRAAQAGGPPRARLVHRT